MEGVSIKAYALFLALMGFNTSRFHPTHLSTTTLLNVDITIYIVKTGLTFLHWSQLMQLSYWPFAFQIAMYLINRLPTPILGLKSPFGKLFSKSSNYQELQTFGCLCYPWLKPYNRHKFCFNRLFSWSKCILLLDISSSRLYTSRDVTSFKNTCFFHNIYASFTTLYDKTIIWLSHSPYNLHFIVLTIVCS